jgi:hypothetical protein
VTEVRKKRETSARLKAHKNNKERSAKEQTLQTLERRDDANNAKRDGEKLCEESYPFPVSCWKGNEKRKIGSRVAAGSGKDARENVMRRG